jgi:hypothetical protein
MNYSLYWNTSSNIDLLFDEAFNEVNGTYYHPFVNGSSYTRYYWSITLTDGNKWLNCSYDFNIVNGTSASIIDSSGMGMIMAYGGGFLLIGLVFGMIMFKRRKKNNNDGGRY